MKAAGLNITPNGSNTDLSDPLQSALLELNLDAEVEPTDANLAQVESTYLNEFLLRAEIRLLKNILGNIEGSDIAMTTGKQENRSQLVEQIRAMLKELRGDLAAAISANSTEDDGTLTGGVLQLDFQEKQWTW